MLGLGSLTGPRVVEVLSQYGARMIVNDCQEEEEFGQKLKPLRELGCQFYLGGHDPSLLEGVQLVIINPAVPLNNPMVSEAHRRGIPVISEIEMAYRLCAAPIIAVTGTNGKTTTTSLLGSLVQPWKGKVVVGGNIGRTLIGLVTDLGEDDLAVAEVSSFQLQTSPHFRPWISLILNLSPDHLDHHPSLEDYYQAKKRILLNQQAEDYTILNADSPLLLDWAHETEARPLFFSSSQELDEGSFLRQGEIIISLQGQETNLVSTDQLRLVGRHNYENVMAASLAAILCGISPTEIRKRLIQFKPPEHRLERVATIGGVTYYNNSKATNPGATIIDLETFSEPVILIAGGQRRGADFNQLLDLMAEKLKAVVLLGETAEELASGLKERGFNFLTKVRDLPRAVERAAQLAERGDLVLLSPASPSWDMFESYVRRGEIFKECVARIREENKGGG